MIAYHGTSHYDIIKHFKKSKSGALGSGLIYFALNEKLAFDYAVKDIGQGKIYTVEVNVSNPLIIPQNEEPVDFVLSNAVALRRKAQNTNYCYWLKASDYNKFRKLGYDCVIYRNELAVFDAYNIKVLDIKEVSM